MKRYSPKTVFNSIKVLISRVLTNLCTSYDKLILVNNVLREHDDIKNVIQKPEDFNNLPKKAMLSYCLKRWKIAKSKTQNGVMTNKEIIIISSKCTVCDRKKTSKDKIARFIKKKKHKSC